MSSAGHWASAKQHLLSAKPVVCLVCCIVFVTLSAEGEHRWNRVPLASVPSSPSPRQSQSQLTQPIPASQLPPPPHFIIIGCMKCGTTSLFKYLLEHPLVREPNCTAAHKAGVKCWMNKELHYFSDAAYSRGSSWYNSLFPALGKGEITGECTPDYLSEPLAARRILQDYPQAKIIVVLRDPATRALSHFRFFLKLAAAGWPSGEKWPQSRSFEKALGADRFSGCMAQEVSDGRIRGALQACCSALFNQDDSSERLCWPETLNSYQGLGVYAAQVRSAFIHAHPPLRFIK